MAGAFALVRFRLASGSAKDISVVFFAMASGLACGLGFVTFAGCFTVIILLVFELTYECRMKDECEQKQFIDELRVRNGNLNITMGMMPDSDGGYLN